jgi:hypothetical protein
MKPSPGLLASVLSAFVLVSPAQAQVWVDVYNPTQVLTLNLTIDDQDWDTIRRDLTNEIEVPAQFWADGGSEPPLLVSVRRKSSRALPSESNPQKVSIKIDINEFVSQTWRGLTKLSLENGADTDPISEGFAWNLHELATGEGLYPAGYHAGLAAWVRLVVNGVLVGLYVNVEERDSQFLRNRSLPRGGNPSRSWLYEIDETDAGFFELEDGNLPHGPTWTELCYPPFSGGGKKASGCARPNDAFLAARLPELIDMPIMLTQGAVDAFSSNRDALFTHGQNFRHIDFNPVYPENAGRKRLYLMWDLDAAITNINENIYAQKSGRRFTQTPYQNIILNHPLFREQYNTIMRALLDHATGPLSESALHAFLTNVEPQVAFALAEDPYAGFTPASAASHFDALRNWVTDRIAIVLTQVDENLPPPRE